MRDSEDQNSPFFYGLSDWLYRLTVAVALLLIAFDARADACFTLYAQSGARPGTKTCELDVVSRTPGGMANYACINDLARIQQWCNAIESDPEPENNCPVADPVFPGSGAVTLSATDFASGDDVPLLFTRTYRSKPLAKNLNAMGTAWFHNWQRHLVLASANIGNSSKILAYRENGEPVTFNWTGDAWRTKSFTGLTLEKSDSGWTLTNQINDRAESYSAEGVLLSETTRSGFARTLTYDSTGLLTTITQHAAGTSSYYDLSLRLDYDGQRRLLRLNDPMAGMTQYGYDANSNLVSVTWPDGNTRRYMYDDPRFKNALTGEIDEAGTRIATWEYDALGRASTVSHPDTTRNVRLVYGHGSTSVTDSRGTTTLNFSSIGGKLRETGSNSVGGSGDLKWDESGRLLKRSYASGNVIEYSYDDFGRPIRMAVRSTTGTAVTSIRYADAISLHPSMIASPRMLLSLVYDRRGNVTGISETPTTDISGENGFNALKGEGVSRAYGRAYDQFNRLISARVYEDGRETGAFNFEYHYDGNIFSVKRLGENGAASRLIGRRDNIHRIDSGINQNRLFVVGYDQRGRPNTLSIKEEASPINGGVKRSVILRYQYSPDGQIVSRTGKLYSTTLGHSRPLSSDEMDRWVASLEANDPSISPPIIDWRLGLVPFESAPDAIKPICVECFLNPALSWGWVAASNQDDPFTIVGLAGAIRGALQGIAQQCSPTQLTNDQLIAAATRSYNHTGLSTLSRAWGKHSERNGKVNKYYPRLTGNIAQKNAFTEKWARDLLENPTTTRKELGRGGIEYRAPNGTGMRFERDGSFNTVLDPTWEKY
ncbi:DUF6531 domain-containing protein [Burkholderia gladioli]|uniref:DUF6531 domain-containing protein n=1 Tax=Burkholderia gladioli TaxID=28095 RepID=UPI0022D23297|nr:DUF6531 domain-containing protein [Burkholderia gladioli]MDA0572972.1 DUF6531 domain-containing protein [Burkholderia gladioli]MDA0601324.1 DUF6531 domain-containing protein [Burkholderia gladioli]